MIYVAHVREAGHYLPDGGVGIPVRVEHVGDWNGGNAMINVRVTAPRTANGYSYGVGARLTVHGNSVRPSMATEHLDGWVWCDGKNHGDACPECGDVHRVQVGIPERVIGGVLVKGCTLVRCRRCNRLMRYLADQE